MTYVFTHDNAWSHTFATLVDGDDGSLKSDSFSALPTTTYTSISHTHTQTHHCLLVEVDLMLIYENLRPRMFGTSYVAMWYFTASYVYVYNTP